MREQLDGDAGGSASESPVGTARRDNSTVWAHARPSRLRARVWRIVAVYALVATLWIYFSDQLLSLVVPDPATLVRWSIYKGLTFVAATSIFLLVMLLRAWGAVESGYDRAVRESQFSEAMIDSMPGILYFYDEHGKFLRWNRNFEQVSGYSGAEIASMHPLQFFAGDDRRRVEQRIASVFEYGESSVEAMFLSKDGSSRPYFFTGRRVVYEGRSCLIGVGIDIARRKDAEGRLEQLALYDTLTGLPNRQLMQDRLQHSLASSARLHLYGALLFADLDDFKTLNDTHGHNTGDQLLQLAAERLQSCVRQGDTVARFGGDEFVVILEALSANPEQAAALAEATGEQMLEVMTERYTLGAHVYHGTMSIGVSLFRDSEIGVEELIRRADTAMHQAKRSGRNTLYFYDPAMQAALESRLQLERDLRLALEQQEFCLYYQPQVDHTGRVTGAEALIRWLSPAKGMISPAEFIPLAEETGLILPLGTWVIETACAQLKAWERDRSTAALELAINVSAQQFYQSDFVGQVLSAVKAAQVNPALLKLELTESLILDDIGSAIVKMNTLREAGLRFAMDDFGTGYSSLSYLTQLPLDQLKIDQSFVHNMAGKPVNAVIVQTIIGMARNLEIEAVAEGVETAEQYDFLKALGCRVFQGYYFGRPVPIADFRF